MKLRVKWELNQNNGMSVDIIVVELNKIRKLSYWMEKLKWKIRWWKMKLKGNKVKQILVGVFTLQSSTETKIIKKVIEMEN